MMQLEASVGAQRPVREAATLSPSAALLIPSGDTCDLDFSGSSVRWLRLECWDGPVQRAHRVCGAAVWLGQGRQERLFALREARASMLPKQPLVALLQRTPTPMESFHLLEVGADSVDVSRECDWLHIVEQLAVGQLRGVALVQEFCESHRLSPRESLTVFTACAGLSKVEAYEALGCSSRTLDTYWTRVFSKVGIRSSVGIVAAVLRCVLPRFAR